MANAGKKKGMKVRNKYEAGENASLVVRMASARETKADAKAKVDERARTARRCEI